MLADIQLLSTQELATRLGYGQPTNAFYDFCRLTRILPVPGRRGWYDPKLVRSRLDAVQGLNSVRHFDEKGPSSNLVAQRRARLAQS